MVRGNKGKSHHLVSASFLTVAAMLAAPAANAQSARTKASPQTAAPDTAQADIGVDDIIVTAQKREENINKVPMSIAAVTDDQLRNAGVTKIADLVKLTPGLTYANSQADTPIYTIRGVGFSDIAAAGRPAVSIYTDQAPIPFSIEAAGISLDLERVEVLKGPQGTLFGTNSTGGAINFIAAKPTREFAAGIDLSYGRFNSNQIAGFVSGPISSTLSARIAVEHDGMGPWQRSYRTGEKLGVQDFWNGRFTLDWAPTDTLKASLTVSRWADRSDTQAPQVIGIKFNSTAVVPVLINYPVAPQTARAADFDANRSFRKDNNFLQTNLRLDYDIAPNLTLTSLTSYSRFRQDQFNDVDGVSVLNNHIFTRSAIRSISEELRLSGALTSRSTFTIGLNYADDHVAQNVLVESPVSSTAYAFAGIFGYVPPVDFGRLNTQNSITKAAFATVDYNLTDALKIYAGGRYTDFRTNFSGCTKDTGDGISATIFTIVNKVPILPGQCITLTQAGVAGIVTSTLKQSNFSWRAGAQWTVAPGAMLYANVSKGYKAGSFPLITATTYPQFSPVTQESLLAYEAGFKAGLFNRTLQINGAAFYYDYTNKQILGSVLLPVFGRINRLINIPKSHVSGVELAISAAPAKGLRISASGTYIVAKVADTFMNYTPFGVLIDFKGQRLPNTPKWQLSGDAEYKIPASDQLNYFVGGNVSYQSAANSAFGGLAFFRTKPYALLDLRAGVETSDGKWRASVWGRNVTNTYYWTAATQVQDTIVRYTGMPATYGVSLSLRYR